MKFLVNADEESIELGILFARALGASVTVVESAQIPPSAGPKTPRSGAQGRGETAVAQFRAAEIDAELIQRKSDWLRALRVVTRAYRYDLVIVGKMWRRGLTGLLFGSVPHSLLADVRANLLIARQVRIKFGRLLIAVAAGPGQKQALRWGGLVARAFEAQPVLFHVTEHAPGMFDGLAAVDESLSQFMRSNTVEARAFAGAAQSLRMFDLEPELKLAQGSVVDEMVTEARAGNYDLIVLGSSYSAAMSARWLMPRVTEGVVKHAPCPVLVVRGEIDLE
jgi:universal stress protein A